MIRVLVLGLIGVFWFSPVTTAAEDLNTIFKKVNDYVAAKNYPKAMEELSWANKEIEKLHMTQLQGFFPDELMVWQGQKIEANSALGLTALERTYTKSGDNSRIKVSLAGGSGSGAGGFGGLAEFGKLAAMMGNQPGSATDTFRISGRTATMTKDDDSHSAELSVFLDSGSILKLEMDNGSNADVLKTLAENLKINEMDNYLRGSDDLTDHFFDFRISFGEVGNPPKLFYFM